MSRLLMTYELVRCIKRALALMKLEQFGVPMWLQAQPGINYTLRRLFVDDTPTNLVRMDVHNFLSPQDCNNIYF